MDCAVDEAESQQQASEQLTHWTKELSLAFEGQAREPIAIRVGEVSESFSLPQTLFEEIVEGVAYDLEPRRFHSFEELGRYCDLVAGAVGKLCVRIFGHAEAWADEYAANLGRALQITNILRDIGPDARRGRFYLPLEDLERFGLSENDILGTSKARLEMLHFEAERAEAYFTAAARLVPRSGSTLSSAEMMGAIYHRLLHRIVASAFPTCGEIVRVPRLEKLFVAGRAWLTMHLPSRGHR